MESLALFLAIVLLTVFSSAFVAIALSFADSQVARGFVYFFTLLSGGTSLFMAYSVGSPGSWGMALVIVALNALAIWNSQRVKRSGEENKRFTSE